MSDKFNYFAVVAVSDTDYPDSPQSNFRFHSKGFSLTNRGSVTVTYSFDGENDHGDLLANDNRVFEDRIANKIWLKVASSTANVRVEAWGASGRG